MRKIYMTLLLSGITASSLLAGNTIRPTAQESRKKANEFHQAHQQKLAEANKTNAVVYKTIGDMYENYSNSNWNGVDSNTYAYNQGAHDTITTNYAFDAVAMEWYPTTQHNYTVRPTDGVVVTDSVVNWLRGTLTWRNFEKYTHTFNGNGLYSSTTKQVWDTIANQWQNTENTNFTYDANNNLTLTVYQVWNAGITQWKNTASQDITYSSANSVLAVTKKNWDAVQVAFRNSSRYVSTYDANNKETEYLIQNWDTIGSLQWMNNSHNLNNYTNGHQTYTLYQNWDGSVWVNYRQINRQYTNARLSYFQQDYWSTADSAWTHSLLFVKTFNTAGNEILESDSTWDTGLSAYTPDGRVETTYNSDNDMTKQESFTWDGTTYKQDGSNTYTYDANRNLILNYSEYYDSGTEGYVPSEKYHYYYQAFTVSGIDETSAAQNIHIYPNPSSAGGSVLLSVNLTNAAQVTINMYENNGKLISAQSKQFAAGNNSAQLNTNNLPAGVYHIQCVNDTDNSVSGTTLVIQ